MKIVIGRFKDGRLKAIVHYEEDTNFWKSELTECLAFPKEKDKIETTLAISHWNENHHDRFEQAWQFLMNLDVFKSFFLGKPEQ